MPRTEAARPKQQPKEKIMWYFAWMLGIGFAVLLAILNAMWGENEEARVQSRREDDPS
jgi:cyd operon protein YbgT